MQPRQPRQPSRAYRNYVPKAPRAQNWRFNSPRACQARGLWDWNSRLLGVMGLQLFLQVWKLFHIDSMSLGLYIVCGSSWLMMGIWGIWGGGGQRRLRLDLQLTRLKSSTKILHRRVCLASSNNAYTREPIEPNNVNLIL